MSVFTQVIEGAAYAGANFHESCHLTTHERDERQYLTVGIIAWERLSHLTSQLQQVFPGFQTYGATPVVLGVGAFFQFAVPSAERYLAKKKKNWALAHLCEKTIALAKFQTKRSNDLINVACAVSYVAMIACGWPIPGLTGFVGLFLIVLKRSGHMPSTLDYFLEPVVLLAAISADLLTPLPNLYRAWKISTCLIDCSNLLVKHKTTKKYLPAYFQKLVPGKHKQVEKWPDKHFDEETVKEIAASDDNFEVNRSHIYSEKLTALPKELIKELADIAGNDLFEKLGEKIKDKKITFDEEEQEGWNDLKKEVVDGCFKAEIVPNLDEFQENTKALLVSLLSNENDKEFEECVKELALLGGRCTEGQLTGVEGMLMPETKDHLWTVHHVLGRRRGEIEGKLFGKVNDYIESKSRGWLSAKLVGGINDHHLNNQVHSCLEHRVRSYEAVQISSQAGRNLFETMLFNTQGRLQERLNAKALCESILFLYYIFNSLEHIENTPFLAGLFGYEVWNKPFDQEYSVQEIVDCVYEAIKNGPRAIKFRQEYNDNGMKIIPIEKQVANEWIYNFEKNFRVDYMLKGDNMWSDFDGCPSKPAVRLLLEHAGILTRNPTQI